MSRHRFLMLGASIVGVGMLPFAQRNYAYAHRVGDFVTPYDYAPRNRRGETVLDNRDHTAVLYDMFSDTRLDPGPYRFHLPPRLPDPKISGDPGGWKVNMGSSGFASFPVKGVKGDPLKTWTLTGEQFDPTDPSNEGRTLDPETLRRSTLPDGTTVLDPASALYRTGKVVHNTRMFQNTNIELGNDNITFSNVYVKGNKYDWAEMNRGYFDIDKISAFLRIYQNPAVASDQWNENLKVLGCIVQEWPGISCVLYQLRNFEVSNNLVTWSHRGSLIFRFGAHNGKVSGNHVLDGGDDCIAFNGNTDNYYEQYPNNPPPKAENVDVWANTLSEKQAEGVRGDGEPYSGGNDIPEPRGGRKRTGNSPISVRGGDGIRIGLPSSSQDLALGNLIPYTMDGYTDSDGRVHAPQPAVEVLDFEGQSARNISVSNLHVQKTLAGALVVPSPEVTGGVYNSVCDGYTGPAGTDPWKLAPPYPDGLGGGFARENLTPPDDYTS